MLNLHFIYYVYIRNVFSAEIKLKKIIDSIKFNFCNFNAKNDKFISKLHLLNYDKIALLYCFLIYILAKTNNSVLTFYSIIYKLWKSTTKFSSFIKNWSFGNILICNILKQFRIFRNCQATLTCY